MRKNKNFIKLKGDASSRVFFRKKTKNLSSIVVYSKKDKKLNLLIYDAINKILRKNHILAPKLLSQNYSKSYIEIQDLGNLTLLDILKKKNVKNKLIIFKKIINLLNKIQLIRQRKIKDFRKKTHKIRIYKKEKLYEEAKLFLDWYIPQKLSLSEQLVFKRKFLIILKNLINKLNLKNDVFVHRDFHVSNLMLIDDNIGLLDSQDALIGNKAYDLASFIDDVRYKNPENIKKKIYNYYLKSQKKLNKKHFLNDFEIISVLRNLKIIGIFTRLAIRDNKKKYLKLIPHAWSLIKLRSKNYNKFGEFNNLLSTFKLVKLNEN